MNRTQLEAAIAFVQQGVDADRHIDSPSVTGHYDTVLQAARKHLETVPPSKLIDVWYMECAGNVTSRPIISVHLTRDAAELAAKESLNDFVKVTGPHKHEVRA